MTTVFQKIHHQPFFNVNYANDCSPYESSSTIEDILHKVDKFRYIA